MSLVSELSLRFEECEKERIAYKTELRELKANESRIMSDFAELEDENISLQKQLMQLKQAQVIVITQKLFERVINVFIGGFLCFTLEAV